MILSTVFMNICINILVTVIQQTPLHIFILVSCSIIFRVVAIFLNNRFLVVLSYGCSSILFLLPLEGSKLCFFDTGFVIESSHQGRLCVFYITIIAFFLSISGPSSFLLRYFLTAILLLRLLFFDFSLFFSTEASHIRTVKPTHTLTTNNSLRAHPFSRSEASLYINSCEGKLPSQEFLEWSAFLNSGTSGRRLMNVSELPKKLLNLNNIPVTFLSKFSPYTDSFMFSTRATLFEKGYDAKAHPFKQVVKFMSLQHQRDELAVLLSACLLEKDSLSQLLYQKFEQKYEKILEIKPSGNSRIDLVANVLFSNGNTKELGISVTTAEHPVAIQRKREACTKDMLLITYTRQKVHMKNILSLSDESFLLNGKKFFPEFEIIESIIQEKKNIPRPLPSDTPIIVPVDKLYNILKKL